MKKNHILILLAVLFFHQSTFAQHKTVLTGFLALSKSTHAKALAGLSQAKTAQLFAPSRSVNYYWNTNGNTWQYSDTSFYTYNSQGLNIELISRNGQPYNRTLNTYDSKSRLIESVNQYWGSFTQQWTNSNRSVTVFDIHDNEIESHHDTYNTTTNQWEINSGTKNIISYSFSNLILTNTKQNYNSTSNTWTDYNRTTNYSYNSNGDATQYDLQIRNGTNWDNDTRTKITYSIFNVFIEEILEYWSGTAFVKSDRFMNITWNNWTGDPNSSTISSYTAQVWGSPLANQWNTSSRNSTSYDAFGGSVSIDQAYSNTLWVNDYKYSEFYDSRLNYTGSKSETWVVTANNWDTDSEQKVIHTYDAANNITESVWQYWNQSSSSLINNRRKVYSDFKPVTGIGSHKELTRTEISVFPNPFSKYCTLRIENYKTEMTNELHLKLYDLFGKEVKQIEINGQDTQIERAGLAPGIYFYTVMDKTTALAKGKLVIE